MKWHSDFEKDGRGGGIELSDQDMEEYFLQGGQDAEAWHKLQLRRKAVVISSLADILVVDYMRDEELISEEWAGQRLRALTARLRGGSA